MQWLAQFPRPLIPSLLQKEFSLLDDLTPVPCMTHITQTSLIETQCSSFTYCYSLRLQVREVLLTEIHVKPLWLIWFGPCLRRVSGGNRGAGIRSVRPLAQSWSASVFLDPPLPVFLTDRTLYERRGGRGGASDSLVKMTDAACAFYLSEYLFAIVLCALSS